MSVSVLTWLDLTCFELCCFYSTWSVLTWLISNFIFLGVNTTRFDHSEFQNLAKKSLLWSTGSFGTLCESQIPVCPCSITSPLASRKTMRHFFKLLGYFVFRGEMKVKWADPTFTVSKCWWCSGFLFWPFIVSKWCSSSGSIWWLVVVEHILQTIALKHWEYNTTLVFSCGVNMQTLPGWYSNQEEVPKFFPETH